ncbi:MAG: exodeoxyribonuclease III [Pseudomonadota bacterium]|nr:exodeoxyribonuclease III [Pseudomonadota bacterium]
MIKVISCNVNGIRSSNRKGFFSWLHDQKADFICLQETKAQMDEGLQQVFSLDGYQAYFANAEKKGYSGVGLYSRVQPIKVNTDMQDATANEEGRYLHIETSNLNIVSLYLPSGTSGDTRQAYKMRLLEHYQKCFLESLIQDTKPWIICGDWNIAHRPIDLKNWRQNQKNSGFLPEERAWLDHVFDGLGWVDAFRVIQKSEGHYTWWSYRGQARARNTGWRIDYQVVSPKLKQTITSAKVVKDPMFSDHAPLIIEYDYEA